MEQEYRQTKASISLINYHFVFCSRYLRKALVSQVAERFKELVKKIAIEKDWQVLAMEVQPDHCHLHLNVLPSDSPATIMAKIRGETSRELRKEFDNLSHMVSLWTRAYLVSTNDISDEMIQRFVKSQKKRG